MSEARFSGQKEYLLFVYSSKNTSGTKCFLLPFRGALPASDLKLLMDAGSMNSEDLDERNLTEAYYNLKTAVFTQKKATQMESGNIADGAIIRGVFSFYECY